MLQEIEFIKWCKDNGMSDLAQQLINQIRMSPPSRKVKVVVGMYQGVILVGRWGDYSI